MLAKSGVDTLIFASALPLHMHLFHVSSSSNDLDDARAIRRTLANMYAEWLKIIQRPENAYWCTQDRM